MLSDSLCWFGKKNKKQTTNPPLAAGALKRQYFKINCKPTLSVLLLHCNSTDFLFIIICCCVVPRVSCLLHNNGDRTKGSDLQKGRESLPDRVRCHIEFSCRCADQVVSRPDCGGRLKEAPSSGHCESCPPLFPPCSCDWSVNIGGTLSTRWGEKDRRSEGSLGH